MKKQQRKARNTKKSWGAAPEYKTLKDTWQINAKHDLGFDPGLGMKGNKYKGDYCIGKIDKIWIWAEV